MIDLRSDGVTRPTEAMYDAMHKAPVGHAAWGEDPTVRELETRVAEALGQEAALFVPSGTMANQIAVRVHTRGLLSPQVICEVRSHLIEHESAGAAANARAELKPLPGRLGMVSVDALRDAIEPASPLRAQTGLLWLENTHNFSGGKVLPLAYHHEVRALAERHGLPVHLDGARLFNAAVALGTEAKRLGETADSVMTCFSKSLGAPVGSAVAGSREFIEQAWRARQQMGGAMYQSGVVAAAALVALEESPKRLHEDHDHCRRLHERLAKEGVVTEPPQTNILMLDAGAIGCTAAAFTEAAREMGVLVAPVSAREVRAVTHRDVAREDVEEAGVRLAAAARQLQEPREA